MKFLNEEKLAFVIMIFTRAVNGFTIENLIPRLWPISNLAKSRRILEGVGKVEYCVVDA